MTHSEIIETRGNFRARIELDIHSEAPYFFAGDPIFDAEDDARIVYGGQVEGRVSTPEVVERVGEALRKTIADRYSWRGEWDRETFERYVRIFHGGSVRWIASGYRGADRYAAVALPEYRAMQGMTGDDLTAKPETSEWEAYIEGDVWGVVIEEKVEWVEAGSPDDPRQMDTWEEVDSCYGYYGRDYAEQTARHELDNYTSEVAA